MLGGVPGEGVEELDGVGGDVGVAGEQAEVGVELGGVGVVVAGADVRVGTQAPGAVVELLASDNEGALAVGLEPDDAPARIVAKMNSLEDRKMTERLYEASQAGVRIDLIVRGFCSLRPGVPGLSENIRVRSVIGRFLEHSRVFYFANGQKNPVDGDFSIGSGDWMYRNLNNRVEAACPVDDPDARARLWELLDVLLSDERNAWELRPDGVYTQLRPSPDADPESPQALGTFESLMRLTTQRSRSA